MDSLPDNLLNGSNRQNWPQYEDHLKYVGLLIVARKQRIVAGKQRLRPLFPGKNLFWKSWTILFLCCINQNFYCKLGIMHLLPKVFW